MLLASRKYVGAVVVSVLSGVLLAAPMPGAFAENGWSLLAPFALLPLLLGMEFLPTQVTPSLKPYMRISRMTFLGRGAIAFGMTWLTGATFYAAAFSWVMIPGLRIFGWNYPVVSAGYFLSCLLFGLHFPLVFSPFIINAARGVRKANNPLPVWSMVMVSVGIELILPHVWPWTFGSLVSSSGALDQWVSVFGASALSPLVIGTSAYLTAAIGAVGGVATRVATTTGVLLFTWLVVWGVGSWRRDVGATGIGKLRKTRIVAVHPGFVGPTRARIEQFGKEGNLDKLIQISQEVFELGVLEKKPELIVWPANVLPDEFLSSDAGLETVYAFARKNDVSVLLHALEFDREKSVLPSISDLASSIAFVARPSSVRSESHTQSGLMPFIETLPLVDSFAFSQDYFDSVLKRRRIVPKESAMSISYTPDFKLSPLVNFDVSDSALVRKEVNSAEAGVLVHLTNGVLFRDTGAVSLLHRMLQLRSVESGRSLVSVSNVENPIAFDPLGRRIPAVLEKQNWQFFEVPVYDAETSKSTFFFNFGNVPYYLLAFFALLSLTFSTVRRAR